MIYPYELIRTKVEEHIFWVAKSTVLKGCVGQGESGDDAVAELAENEKEWLTMAEKYGIDIPEIPIEEIIEHSGKFTVRVAPYVHKDAAAYAKKQGVSLTQYVNDAIVAQNSRLATIGDVTPEIREIIAALKAFAYEGSTTSRSSNRFARTLPQFDVNYHVDSVWN